MTATEATSVEAVTAAMEQVMRVMYFCDAVYLGRARLETPALGAFLAFAGTVNGVFRVFVSQRRAKRMTADFLALDSSEVTPARIRSTVNEFGNVACGAAMSAWLPQASFHFSVPAELSPGDIPAEFEHCFAVSDAGPEIAIEIVLQ